MEYIGAGAGMGVWCCVVFASAGLVACGGGGSDTLSTPLALRSNITVGTPAPGATPFNATVTLQGQSIASLASVDIVIAAKPGSVSKPVHVTYSMAALTSRGYANVAASSLTLPLFGLYEASTNTVAISLTYTDQSVQQLPLSVTTAAWVDPLGVYQHPTVNVQRAAGSALGYDFFAIKASGGPLVVVDTDGAVRWAGPPALVSMAATYVSNGFVVGSVTDGGYTRVEWDAARAAAPCRRPIWISGTTSTPARPACWVTWTSSATSRAPWSSSTPPAGPSRSPGTWRRCCRAT